MSFIFTFPYFYLNIVSFDKLFSQINLLIIYLCFDSDNSKMINLGAIKFSELSYLPLFENRFV